MASGSIRCVLEQLAQEDPAAPILTYNDRAVTRSEFDRATNRLARVYRDLGVGHGDYVTIGLKNGIPFFESAFAALKLGAVPNPVSWRLPVFEFQAIIDLAKSALVVTDVEGLDCPGSYLPSTFAADPSINDSPLPDVVSPAFKAPVSGGSTGRPKIIVSGFPGEVEDQIAFGEPLKFELEDTFLLAGPLYHNAPFTFALYTLLLGGHVVIMERFDPEESLRLIDRHQVTYAFLVPTMMHRIWRLGDTVRSRYDLSSLRIMMHAAAPCSPELKMNWIDWLGPERVWELYGGTEAQGLTMMSGLEYMERPGTVGRMIDGFEAKVCDEQGIEVPRGQTGEIYMRPAAGQGTTYRYIGAEARALSDGFETIGDIGHMDADGYLFLADRRTDMIISGGANIYPAEIESALEAHPAVRSAVVIGLPDDDLGQVAHAIVDAPGGVGPDELLDHCRDRLVTYKLPRTVEFVTTLLRDDAGKVRRSALRDERLRPGRGAVGPA
jgi:bile acid-coenzyme A ligase